MQAEQSELLARVSKLESRPTGTGSTASTDGEKRPALVFGGWPPKSRRQVVLKELAGVLKDVGADECLDELPWTPGPRRGVALAGLRLRTSESFDDMRDRMLEVADLINKAALPTASTQDSCPVWCTIDRDRSQRVESGHASRLRRMLHATKIGIDNTDTDYKEGSVYKDDVLIGSVVLPAPDGTKVVPGRVPGSWFAPQLFAQMAGVEEEKITQLWQAALQS